MNYNPPSHPFYPNSYSYASPYPYSYNPYSTVSYTPNNYYDSNAFYCSNYYNYPSRNHYSHYPYYNNYLNCSNPSNDYNSWIYYLNPQELTSYQTPSHSSRGLDIILIAILTLSALDLIVLRPFKHSTHNE